MKFANSKKRIIQTSDKGKMFIQGASGRQYNPKAAFKVMTNGSMVKLSANNTKNIPSPIRPRMDKKPRVNKGVSRGPREGSLLRMMNTESRKMVAKGPRKPRANKGVPRGPREGSLLRMMNTESRKMVAKGPRKPRVNKGVPRGPREGTILRRMNTESRKMVAKGPRKPRANKGVPRGPREGTILRRMNTNSRKTVSRPAPKRKPMKINNKLTPEEAVLYQMIFGSPNTQKKIKAANPQLKDPKRVKAGKKAAGTRSLKKLANAGRFNAIA